MTKPTDVGSVNPDESTVRLDFPHYTANDLSLDQIGEIDGRFFRRRVLAKTEFDLVVYFVDAGESSFQKISSTTRGKGRK